MFSIGSVHLKEVFTERECSLKGSVPLKEVFALRDFSVKGRVHIKGALLKGVFA